MNTPIKKVIFVNRFFYPDTSATSQILSDLTFELEKEGDFKIIVVTSRKHHQIKTDYPHFELINNVEIHRVWTTSFGRGNLLGRIIDYVSFYLTCSAKLLHLTERDSIIVAKTDPPLISFFALLVTKIKSAQLVNWIQDLYPEVAAALGVKFIKGPIYDCLVKARNYTLKQASTSVVIGELMEETVKKYGIDKRKTTVIHNWANETTLVPLPHKNNDLRTAWNLQNKFVIGYSGNLGRSHDFETLLSAAEKLTPHENIIFLVIGSGASLPKILEIIELRKLNNVILKPFQPREMLNKSLSVADVHIVSLKTQLEGLIVPSKFYGIAAVARPIIFIGSVNGQIASIINTYRCGRVCPENDSNKLAHDILELYENPEIVTTYGKALRILVENRFSLSQATTQWRNLLTKL